MKKNPIQHTSSQLPRWAIKHKPLHQNIKKTDSEESIAYLNLPNQHLHKTSSYQMHEAVDEEAHHPALHQPVMNPAS